MLSVQTDDEALLAEGERDEPRVTRFESTGLEERAARDGDKHGRSFLAAGCAIGDVR